MATETANVATPETEAPAVATATATETKTTTKPKVQKTGDVIADVAHTTETLTKTKARNRAKELAEDIDRNSFELGGTLKVIFDQGWFEPYTSFDEYVGAEFGFQGRKARYLIEIYTNLVEKQIPWDAVKDIGWSKLKEIARYLTKENLNEMVEKAKSLTVLELIAALKAQKEGGEEGGETKTTADVHKLNFKLKKDQLETVQSALAKGKAEAGTDFDSVALENICAGYLGGTIAAAKGADLKTQMQQAGWETVMGIFGELWPHIVVELTDPTEQKDEA